jgi:ATP-dependent Clp protease ATP-binding subunit ClpC
VESILHISATFERHYHVLLTILDVQVNEELKQYFRPEFLNRLDEIIVFRQLTKSEVKQIADIMLRDVIKRAKDKEITIDLTERWAPALLV